MSDPKLATKADLTEFYQRILPYLGGSAAAGFTPIGTIIAVFGETAPANYLICDGTAYNKADYPELAAHLLALTDPTPYEVSGDNTKFKVPDLRGEFLRGTGTNSHAFSGSGASVGVHQNPTQLPGLWHESANKVYMGTSNSFDSASNNFMYHDTDTYVAPRDIGGTIRKALTISTTDRDDQHPEWNFGSTIRPTNTSVLYCIATKNIYMGGGGSSLNYSTDEQVVGTWIDEKPIYQKTIHETITTYSDNEHRRTFVSSAIANVDTLVFSENAYIDQYGGWVHETYSSQFVAQRTVYTYLNLETHDLDCRAQYNNQLNPITSVTLNCTVRYTKTTD